MGSKSGRQSIVSAMIPSPSKLNAHRHMSGVYASHSFPGSNSLDDDPHSLSRRRTMFGSQGQLRNRFNLQFFDEHIERRYQQFHRHLSLPNWRWTIGAMLMVEMVSFIYMIIALPKESALLEQQRLECTPG
jgi:hypothetical protein